MQEVMLIAKMRKVFHSPARLRARLAGVILERDVHLASKGQCLVASGAKIAIGEGSSFHRDFLLRAEEGANIYIGKGVHFSDRARLTAGPHARIFVADGCWFNHDVVIDCRQEITIGQNCLFGAYSYINDNNHLIRRSDDVIKQGYDTEALVIGDGVWLGVGATLIKGCSLGNGAIVAARAVVNKEVPAFEVWGAVPAKRLAERY